MLNCYLGVHCRYRKFFNLNKKDAHVNHAIDILYNTKKLDGAQKIPKISHRDTPGKDKPSAKKQALTSDSVSE